MFDYIDFSSLNNESDIITPSYKNQLFFRDQLTNYMIRNNNIKHPIIYGRDNWDRLFITIYCYQNKKKKIQTFFQRYPKLYTGEEWIFGNCFDSDKIEHIFSIKNYTVNIETDNFIKMLINEKKILPEKWLDKDINKFSNNIDKHSEIKLYNYWNEKWELLIYRKLIYQILIDNLNQDIVIKILKYIYQ